MASEKATLQNLTNRKLYICINNGNKTNEQKVTCGVPQGYILGPLLFLIYVNDLPSASNLLKAIMFADDTKLFFKHKDISVLFSSVNRELQNINEWFISNKLSLNVKKTNFLIFHKASRRDDSPLVLPKLFINNQVIKRQSSRKFLGILLDENLSYINYANLVRGNTHKTYLRKINSQQKHVLRLIHNKSRFSHSKELFESCEILNVYKINLLNTAVFMHKIKNRTAPSSFFEKFEQPSHSYSIRFSSGNYRKPQIKLHKCRFRISIRGPAIWNDLVGSMEI